MGVHQSTPLEPAADVLQELVNCTDLYGCVQKVPRQEIILRPAAYAIVLQAQKLLVLRMKATGRYHLPGGGIEPAESIAETLRRELREEAGIEIEVGRLAHFEEIFFYYNPSGRAYHGLHFFYLCKPASIDLLRDEDVVDGSAEKPAWVPVQGLRAEDFQSFGATIIELCHRL